MSEESFSEDCDTIDGTEIEDSISDVIQDLEEIQKELRRDLVRNAHGSNLKFCKMHKLKLRLEIIDSKLLEVQELIKPNPIKDDNLVSNFGMSLKVENANNKLNATLDKHKNLRNEWYSQEEHLDKLAKEVAMKDNELQLQSVFCTTQGLILSKMLWKASNFNMLLDKIISNENWALEIVRTLDGCLYALIQTYYDEMPEPTAEEYQYVLCLCGILSNIASVPDGRFLLTRHQVCLDVYDHIIRVLPYVLTPKAEDLKSLMMTALYNLMICKEGEDYAKNNEYLLPNLSECISAEEPHKITMLALKIMFNLTNEITNESYMKYVSSYLPLKRLQELQNKGSLAIRKQAKLVVGNTIRSNKFFQSLEREELIHTTELDGPGSICRIAGTQTYPNKKPPEVLTYYVFTDQSGTTSPSSTSQSTSVTSTKSTEVPSSTTVETSTYRTSTEGRISSTPISSKRSRTLDTSQSSPLSPKSDNTTTSLRIPRSAPAKSSRGKYTSSLPTDYVQTPDTTEDNSTSYYASASCDETRPRKSIQTNYLLNKKFNNNAISTLCCPSTMSMPERLSHPDQEDPASSVSEEIQSLQCQVPHINLNKFYSITIGDNLQNANRNNVGTAYVGKENTGSIVTVFRISRSRALLTSDNSFTPFYSNISTNTSFCWEAAMKNFFKMQTPKSVANKKSAAIETAGDYNDNDEVFDIAYGGYAAYHARMMRQSEEQLSSRPETPHDPLDMPSTSTGYYGGERRYSPFVGVRDANVSSSSGSLLETKQASVLKMDKHTSSSEREVKSKECQSAKSKSKTSAGRKSSGKSEERVKSVAFRRKNVRKKGPILKILKNGGRRKR